MNDSAPPSIVGEVRPAWAKKAACAGDMSGDGRRPGRPPGVMNVLTLSGANCSPAGAAACGVIAAGDDMLVLLPLTSAAAAGTYSPPPDTGDDLRSSVSCCC